MYMTKREEYRLIKQISTIILYVFIFCLLPTVTFSVYALDLD
jgi:hypothetical protein